MSLCSFISSVTLHPPSSTLFPYTTLFRSNFSLALKADGTVWAWGSNDAGQLGDGTFIDRSTPVRVANLPPVVSIDRKSTRLNSSHVAISYAVFCLKKKKQS